MIAGEVFRQGMRQFASSVSIVTTRFCDKPYGLTATAVCSLSTDPPALIVCVNKSASAHDAICRSHGFCVNVLDEDQRDLAKAFAGAVAPENRFLCGLWLEVATGAPVLADALASFDCKVLSRSEANTHSVFVGLVVAARQGEGRRSLLYGGGNYGRFNALAA